MRLPQELQYQTRECKDQKEMKQQPTVEKIEGPQIKQNKKLFLNHVFAHTRTALFLATYNHYGRSANETKWVVQKKKKKNNTSQLTFRLVHSTIKKARRWIFGSLCQSYHFDLLLYWNWGTSQRLPPAIPLLLLGLSSSSWSAAQGLRRIRLTRSQVKWAPFYLRTGFQKMRMRDRFLNPWPLIVAGYSYSSKEKPYLF